MPQKCYHGKTRRVYNGTQHTVGIVVKKQVKGKILAKRINVRIEHIKHSKSRDSFLKQMKTRATQWSFTLDNRRGEGGGHSEELEPLKPSSSERKLEVVEHIDSGDGQFVDESINKFQSDKNSNNLVMESFSEGERLHRIVSCTACGQQVNHFQKDSIYSILH
uniref:60S ribosomal protein L21 n=1 Tax=Phascolarctos cinereus TaxID=38626 RepID=A0A6P5JWF0_PHACI|nr:60S ribosomal protein L21-A-like [Phascolarctos cinereus]